MAQAATMGPPLSPRETRRSGRRSAPSASASTSKSPDSPAPESAPRAKDSSTRSAPPNNNTNARTKRPKQEDIDDPIPNKNAQPNGSASNHANSNGRSKRKGKEKEKPTSMDQLAEHVPPKHSSASTGTAEPQDDDAEEQGITRCICGTNGSFPAPSPSSVSSSVILSPEDDAEGGEFMVQCETCNVWQHGICMGFESEAQLAAADYYCEQCKPERHQDLLKRLAKKTRESSTHSRNTTSRLSRSHSPTHLLKPPKRRNTMNSRDAAFDESLKELIEATAAEAAAADPPKPGANGCTSSQSEAPDDDSNGRKKRKRGEDDTLPKKRTRSASSASDGADAVASVVPEELPPPTKRSAGGKSGNSRNRRGGARRAVPTYYDAVVSVEGEEGTGPSKRSTQTTRGKAGPTPKRPPPSSHAPGSGTQDSSSKRNHSGTGAAAGSSAESSRAYRNSHAYAISQQPLFTSWNLPDYLAHLEHMLPTDIPRPLEVRSLAIGTGGRESLERTMERGVKVKWPSKRMSVGDMNKRVRALVEWVGREQAGALDRGRRREALERALKSSTSGTRHILSDSSVHDDRDLESPIRPSSPRLSIHGEHVDEDHGGDYSTRMEELFDDDEDEHGGESGDGEEDFVYDGVDAELVTGTNYREHLRDVLGADDTSDVFEEAEVERSLLKEDPSEKFGDHDSGEPSAPAQIILDPASLPQSPFTKSAMATPPSEPLLPPLHSPGDPLQSFLLPSVSRLRSFASWSPRNEVNHSLPADISAAIGFASPPSRVSDISRSSTPAAATGAWMGCLKVESEVFRWAVLQTAGNQLYGKRPSKAAIVLGASNLGSPTVLAANGLICVGTDAGRIFVFDFKQTLLGICGNDASDSTVGSTSAVALSHDHTYVASGHVSGYIQIFDLKNPQVPARIVAPPSSQAVMSGRQEGHLAGSRIVNVSFVADRHTAIISADEHGLSFYHSLGKVLFVEASDTIRILGNYPQEPNHENTTSLSVLNAPSAQSFRRRKLRSTLLAMATLPLGTIVHPTDTYKIVALLTVNKLVMVGLKPSPKTWLKRARADDAESTSSGRRRGALAWFPSTNTPQGSKDDGSDKTHPTLAYSWGRTVRFLRVSETMVRQSALNKRTGKTREVDMGTLVFEDAGSWTVDEAVLALQWLNANQLLAFTAVTLSVYDVRTSKLIEHVPFNASALVSPPLGSTTDGSMSYSESLSDVAHSIRTYKGKIFLLCREELQVGTMLTWADKILSLVEQGDFLSALELTRSYYTGEVPGNRNGLPDAAQEQKAVLGQKLHELMVASASYAFSEDRMTDGTHFSPDGRGVDRTSLFEGLVTSCARSCITLDDYNFLFEDLFQHFEDAGITRIYLEQLETFVLAGAIDFVPPRITQRLVAFHDDSGQPALAERVIWHIDPSCLDINQAIRLCQTHQLWDALIYVYTRALQDYVSPIVELISLISQPPLPGDPSVPNGTGMQRTTSSLRHAYKIFPYLVNVLSGQTYPSGEPLPPDEAEHAKYDVYNFTFSGTSAVWPSKGGHLILTGNGAEPTYPYARLLLRFDAESFLHSLDIAFEDSFLTDSPNISRVSIIKILLDIASCQDLPLSATIFINIFIARNIPKYPQYIHTEDIDPRVLYDLLLSLATSLDPETREDRQLAAEYLLSAYTPRDSSEIEKIFENAGFYRILQNRHRHERQWTQLLSSYLLDPSLQSASLLPCVEEVLDLSKLDNHSALPEDIQSALSAALGHLLTLDLQSTATLVDKFAPSLHETALNIMDPTDDRRRYDYLLHLINSQVSDREDTSSPYLPYHPHISEPLHLLFIKLQCRYMPSGVIETLNRMRSSLDWPAIERICEENHAYGAVLWALNQRGQPRDALTKAEAFEKQLAQRIARTVLDLNSSDTNVDESVNALREIGQRGASICLEHSSMSATTAVPLEDIWFQLLSSQLHSVQVVSNLHLVDGAGGPRLKTMALSSLRELVQNTFASLVTISSTRAVSFPRLFKRLVDPRLYADSTPGTPYTEFRTILTGMMESYRSDGDMLSISQMLLNRDVFDTVEEYTKEKMRGWSVQNLCSRCHQTLLQHERSGGTNQTNISITVTRTAIYHTSCQH
ncbi:hypothetical protein J3R82DRAFT_10721 [Butyriboletus roseoflavus]|nr:hypothetical protein J3R82DRAFT_10721 [Butyriboletus roseoflavus]